MSISGQSRAGTGASRASGFKSPLLPSTGPRHPGPHATTGTSAMRPSIASSASGLGGRPSSVASSSSRVTGVGASSSSRRRRLEDLVLATVPSARPRRSETDQRKVAEREAFRSELVALLEDILETNEDVGPIDEDSLMRSLKRKLSKYDVDGSQGASTDLEKIVSKLKRQPDIGTRYLDGLLTIMEKLAYHGKSPATHGPDPGPARPRSSMLNVPEAEAARRDSRDTLNALRKDFDHRRPSALPGAKSSSDSLPLAPVSPEPRQAAPRTSHEEAKDAEAPFTISHDDIHLPKSALLERWRAHNGRRLIAESELLSDIIYLLQGINGKHVGFEDAVLPASNEIGENREAQQVVKVKFFGEADSAITPPTKDLIHRIAELGRLYRRIDEFHRKRSQQENTGLIMQSLCHFLSSELTDYYRLVAILEAQMKQHQGNSDNPGDSSVSKGLTLRRIAVWTEEVTLRMRLISTIIESCQDAHGGAIVSLIHSYTFHGDPLIRNFTAEILEHVSKPFFHALSLWIFEGELQDPFNEFFVEGNKDLKATWGPSGEEINSALYMSTSQDHVASPSSLWQNQFRFRTEMLPSFLGEVFGKKIFSTGKSLNFIRFGCGDASWVAARNTMSDDGLRQATPLRYANLPGLERTIDEAYASASSRLLDIFLDKFKLMDHLRALKDYLMLTKGDFTDLLMESIGPSLDKPASSLFRHNLTASLETSIRGSNSQYDDVDIVGRLDARILDFSEGDLGWDSFTLEYRVDEPVSTVLDNHSMLGYQVIFNHLWKMKRVELALGGGWEHLLLAANMLRRSQPRKIRRAVSGRKVGNVQESTEGGNPELVRTAHEALGHLSEQIHFVKQMQGFINLEVIEYSWNDLTQLLASHSTKRRQIDLDELISSHRAYLNALIAKVLLRGASSSAVKRGHGDQLALEVKGNLDTMLAFATAIDDLARFIVDELARADLVPRSTTPTLSSQSNMRPATAPSSLGNIQSRLTTHYAKFQSSTNLIISRLEKHSNLVVRDLATRLNFNSYYTDHRASTSSAHHGRRTQANNAGSECQPPGSQEEVVAAA